MVRITDEDLNDYRRKHHLPVSTHKRDIEKQHLLETNNRLREENEMLKTDKMVNTLLEKNARLEHEIKEFVEKKNLSDQQSAEEKMRLEDDIKQLREENDILRGQLEDLTATEGQIKMWCRKETQRLIRKGEILLTPCEVCGKYNVHSHHPDYNDPYNVRFLCPYHHYELHYLKSIEAGDDGLFFKNMMNKYSDQ